MIFKVLREIERWENENYIKRIKSNVVLDFLIVIREVNLLKNDVVKILMENVF